jgi:hypothetical protein
MNSYWWKCHACSFGNPPELTNCSNCGYPYEAIEKYIESRSNNFNKPEIHVNPKLSIIQEIILALTYVSSGIGVLILMSNSASPKLNALGIVLLIVGVMIFTIIRGNAKNKETKETKESKNEK